jgi:hypothetical protein
MNIFKNIILILIASHLFIQCSNENEYLIGKGNVGLLNSKTTIKDLKIIFVNDSIVSILSEVKTISDDSFFNTNDEYIIYSKNGKKLLSIVPIKQNDSTSKLKSIELFDTNYSTKTGVNLKSTFKDIKNNYVINKVETTLSSATLYIDELNATIAFDKKEIGISSFNRSEISINQIPDPSKIKYFTIWFN